MVDDEERTDARYLPILLAFGSGELKSNHVNLS